MRNPLHPKPAPPAFGQDSVVPERSAPWLSRLLFHWLSPIMSVGFSRPLETEDLWQLDPIRRAHGVADNLSTDFFNQVPKDGIAVVGDTPDVQRSTSGQTIVEEKIDLGAAEKVTSGDLNHGEKEPRVPTDSQTKKKTKKPKKPSLLRAIHRVFFYRIWSAGAMKFIADTLNTTSPLVNKALLNWLSDAYAYHKLGAVAAAEAGVLKPKGIGYGFGLAVALFCMQELSSLFMNHYTQISMTNGLTIRAGVISTIFRKSLRLSGRARLTHSIGQITTMISTDATRLDFASAFVHQLWVSPIQIMIGIGLLINNLGVSALVGLGVLVFGFPVQAMLVRLMFAQRKKGVKLTDRRVRLSTEVLQGIRLLKYYAWEAFYADKIAGVRKSEINTIKITAFARALMISFVTFIPIMASILSFITYALTGHKLTTGVIFSSLQLFNIIRMPLAFIPLVFSTCSDAVVALGRISKFLLAEEIDEPYTIDRESDWAVEAYGDFTWETADKGDAPDKKAKKSPGGSDGAKKGKKEKKEKKAKKGAKDSILPTVTSQGLASEGTPKGKEKGDEPFALKDLSFRVPKGAFVALVGRVGSGKSSVLQSLIGEMRKSKGSVVFSGSVAYVPQTAWIMNATLRENILFGQDNDEDRFDEIVHACQLEQDIAMLPHGDQTEIGEKGINLSGGQKARVSLARASYSESDIILLDDSLSAVDAHVGKAIVENCLLDGPLAKRTRILVTHALHVLPLVDRIYVVDNGRIVEEGTYEELLQDGQDFARLIEEYGSMEKSEDTANDTAAKPSLTSEPGPKVGGVGIAKTRSALMSVEERETGAVTSTTYAKYLKAAGGLVWAPIMLVPLALAQAAQVGNNLFLGFWTAESIPGFTQSEYMGVYAALGVAQALFSFASSFAFSLTGLRASFTLFKGALIGVLRSPISFFDTTPMGRIMSRLSKDQDTLDTQLAQSAYQVFSTFSSVIGTVALVFYTFPILGVIFVPLSIFYYYVAIFYRRTSVEVKRLDSILRSTLYASYAEALTGLSTVRAYGDQDRFIANAEQGIDNENRAYYMVVSAQRWLGVRLDLLGNILILAIAFVAVGSRNSVNPAKIGVVISYTLSITQVFSFMVSQYAMMEQNMNAAERVLVYNELPVEGERHTSSDPPPSWPTGLIKFSNAALSYRPGLPLVLKDVSFEVNPGEKIGIVGRTGAGKSSLLQALFRIVELQSGKIEIDGVDIRKIGLDVLRERMALVPQDTILFLGTLRENLDPLNTRTDAEIITALRRTWLLPQNGASDPAAEAKFSLDSVVGDEGSNFSAGERQLIALCRALVKGSKIIVLDEASSSVDVETDSKVQRTIQQEFADSTLLCIAHRLNTIVYYDRIIVMDHGKVAEFDTPLALFDNAESIFRSLCNEAGLSRQDIVRIRSGTQQNSSRNSTEVSSDTRF
ncbi:multidrug resistance-associated ABC transporter [Sistotremastrum niveocremeum HHB9708]|uniref:Multidrug resistance-associated ABC transporter n=1 Tax=Sistotremastrum niveocremeum HHB9708 TaxID=1314777 RepID=A0A164R155_9AGAM|nr:multidrug resistance-associated ABC transporter [Sistotremastrum niveocremeum HHB9708]